MGQSAIYVHRVFPESFVDLDFYDRPMPVPLTQSAIHQIDLDSLPGFLESEYRQLDSTNFRNYFTCIKSPTDTITNSAFPVIQKFFQDRKFKAYIIRKRTQQEKELIISMK